MHNCRYALADKRAIGHSVAMAEHAVLVYITSLPADSGLDLVEDPIIEAIDAAEVGEFDGNEIGADGAVLTCTGPMPTRCSEQSNRRCEVRLSGRVLTPSNDMEIPGPRSHESI